MDNRILSELYKSYAREIYLYLYSLCKDSHLAEELMQESFCKAILSLSSAHTNMRAWLYTVARNLCLNELKKRSREYCSENPQDLSDIVSDAAEHLISEEQAKAVFKAISRLELRRREILQLQYFSGFTLKSAAKFMGLSYNNARVLSHRAKKELKNLNVEIVMIADVNNTYGIFIHDPTGNLIELLEEM